MSNPSQRLKAIRNVKKKLAAVQVTEVADHLKMSRQNIYYHLNEEKADTVNMEVLAKISAAIDAVKKLQDKKDSLQLKKIA